MKSKITKKVGEGDIEELEKRKKEIREKIEKLKKEKEELEKKIEELSRTINSKSSLYINTQEEDEEVRYIRKEIERLEKKIGELEKEERQIESDKYIRSNLNYEDRRMERRIFGIGSREKRRAAIKLPEIKAIEEESIISDYATLLKATEKLFVNSPIAYLLYGKETTKKYREALKNQRWIINRYAALVFNKAVGMDITTRILELEYKVMNKMSSIGNKIERLSYRWRERDSIIKRIGASAILVGASFVMKSYLPASIVQPIMAFSQAFGAYALYQLLHLNGVVRKKAKEVEEIGVKLMYNTSYGLESLIREFKNKNIVIDERAALSLSHGQFISARKMKIHRLVGLVLSLSSTLPTVPLEFSKAAFAGITTELREKAKEFVGKSRKEKTYKGRDKVTLQ